MLGPSIGLLQAHEHSSVLSGVMKVKAAAGVTAVSLIAGIMCIHGSFARKTNCDL